MAVGEVNCHFQILLIIIPILWFCQKINVVPAEESSDNESASAVVLQCHIILVSDHILVVISFQWERNNKFSQLFYITKFFHFFNNNSQNHNLPILECHSICVNSNFNTNHNSYVQYLQLHKCTFPNFVGVVV